MPTFDPGKEWEYSVLRSVIADKFEATLGKYQVKVGILMAHPTRDKQPAMKVKGYPIYAKIKILGLEDRVAGQPDARILIDANAWHSMSGMKQEALIAHELYHLELVKVEGLVQTDDAGRPCLKNRTHDVEAGMFREVYEWYGEDSIEYEHRQAVIRAFDQPRLPFGVDSKPDPDQVHAARKREIVAAFVAAEAESDIVRDTFAALISVGYTESQARKAVHSVISGRGVLRTVSDMVDAIYQQNLIPADAVDTNAELNAGVREKEAEKATADIAKNEFNAKNNWRYRPVAEMKLSPETAAILERERVHTVGELVARRNRGSLATALKGDFAFEVTSQLGWFLTVIPEVEVAYLQEVLMQEVIAAEEQHEAKPTKPAPSPHRDADDAWRHILIVDLMLAPVSLERLQEHDIETVGELVSLTAKGSLDSVLTGQVALDVDNCMDRFYGSLPTAQAVDLARAKDPEARPIEPKKTRGRREAVTA